MGNDVIFKREKQTAIQQQKSTLGREQFPCCSSFLGDALIA